MTIVISEMTMRKATLKKKPRVRVRPAERTIAAGEFKAKCLHLMDEVRDMGASFTVTKRGQPVAKLVPITDGQSNLKMKDDFFGRLVGVMEIVGDPDDLIKPVFALEDYDMLK